VRRGTRVALVRARLAAVATGRTAAAPPIPHRVGVLRSALAWFLQARAAGPRTFCRHAHQHGSPAMPLPRPPRRLQIALLTPEGGWGRRDGADGPLAFEGFNHLPLRGRAGVSGGRTSARRARNVTHAASPLELMVVVWQAFLSPIVGSAAISPYRRPAGGPLR